MPLPHEFGGDWTDQKVDMLRRYLEPYAKIFKNGPRAKNLEAWYIDAFAGTGYRAPREKTLKRFETSLDFDDPLEEDLTEEERQAQSSVFKDEEAFRKGSAAVALDVEAGFKHFLFIEKSHSRVKELEHLAAQHPDKAGRIHIVQGDGCAVLTEWCQKMTLHQRAVVFLDPYGMQVDWDVIQVIAQTKKIDLWLLIPLGQAINRLLTTGGPPPPKWSEKLTRFFGTNEWQEHFYASPKPHSESLFGEDELAALSPSNQQYRKSTTFEGIGQFFVDRLKTEFNFVARNPRPLYNATGVPLYLLCFAAGHPIGGPIALGIAEQILRKG